MKKIFCFILAVAMLFAVNTSSFAESDEQYKNLSEITEEELTNYALNFAKEVNSSLELRTGGMTPIYNNDDKLVGYSIEYYVSDTPYGYINLDFTYEDPVVEFVIHENARSMYAYLENDVQDIDTECQIENILYNTSPFEYSVSVIDSNNQQTYYNPDNGEMTSDEFDTIRESEESSCSTYGLSTETKYDSHNELFSTSYESGSTVVASPKYTSKYSASKSMISQREIMTSTSRYACAVVALTEIANQEGILKNSSIKDTFNALWTATSTTVESTETHYNMTISCGSTLDSNLASGMKSYCVARGKTSTTTTTASNPAFAFFVGAIRGNYSATLTYRIYLSDGTKSGHTVNVIGYCSAKKSGTTSYYLIVADGWYSDAKKYMNYSSIDFVNTYGVKYIIE